MAVEIVDPRRALQVVPRDLRLPCRDRWLVLVVHFWCILVATDTHTGIMGYRKLPPSVSAYAPTHSSKPQPRAPPPDPRLKPRPVFVASGGVKMQE